MVTKKVHHKDSHKDVKESHKSVHHKEVIAPSEPVHIRLNDPLSLRRSILESAVLITKMLRSYEDLKLVKEQKEKLRNSFDKTSDELRNLVNQINKKLPKLEILEHEEHRHVEEHFEMPAVKEEVSNSEILKLKMELQNIEDKLRHL